MSGTLSSRFQPRFGYGPGLRVGAYPSAQQSLLPSVSAPPVAQPGGLPAVPAPSAPAPVAAPQTPVSAGSVAQDSDGGGSGWDQATNSTDNLGPNPGSLGQFGGLSGFGFSNYGDVLGTVGTLGGLATGVPGMGTVASAFGGYLDAQNLSAQLESMGLAPVDALSAAVNAASPFGAFGTSANTQFGDIIGFDAFAEAPLSSFQGQPTSPGSGGFASPEAQAVSDAIGAGFGPESPGYGGYGGDGGGYGGGSSDSAADGPGAGGGVGADGGVGQGGDAWMSGGYTGAGQDGTVQPAQPAGTVHEGETVLNAKATAYYGPDLLLLLNSMDIPRSRLAELAGV